MFLRSLHWIFLDLWFWCFNVSSNMNSNINFQAKIICNHGLTKGGFFSESAIHFSNPQNENIPNHYPELEMWLLFIVIEGKFGIFFFWIFGDLKNISQAFWKKPSLNWKTSLGTPPLSITSLLGPKSRSNTVGI